MLLIMDNLQFSCPPEERKLRKCGREDLERLADFYRLVIRETKGMARYARWEFGKHPTEEAIAEYIRQGAMYVLEEGQEIAAAVAVTPCQGTDYHGAGWQADLKDDDAAVVHLLAVNPRLQKRGCAKAVMQEVIRMAKNRGLKTVRLDALKCNLPAHRLYESLGFKKRGVCRWYAENPGWYDFYLFEYLL